MGIEKVLECQCFGIGNTFLDNRVLHSTDEESFPTSEAKDSSINNVCKARKNVIRCEA
jgi:hypothetical protein